MSEKVEQSTVIDIEPDVEGMLIDDESPYYLRTDVATWIRSTTRFDKIVVSHLGFRARSKGRGRYHIKFKDGRYEAGETLEPETSALVEIKPFHICLVNVGDSFLKVNVRMRAGLKQCKMTILQEKHQAKAPKAVDTFIEYEGIYYCTATINCLQTVRIEELGEDATSEQES